METNLQSNEVRIPKSPQSPGICPQFKSTFARSLSFNTNSQPNKPLDLEISFRIAQNVEHSSNVNGSTSTTVTQQTHKIEDTDEDFEEFMRNSPLKQSMQNLSAKSTTPTTPTHKNAVASRAYNTTCSGRHRFQDTQRNKSCSPEIELLRLRKECQILLEENRRLVNRNGSNEIMHGQDTLMPTTNGSVEEAVLQTQIETLQWQLTQVESSRQMYHALMEEVVRFLERCYQSIESMQKNNKIARSRSINHMFIDQSAQTSTKNERRVSDIGSLRSNLNIVNDKTGVNVSIEKDQLNDSFASSVTTTSNSTDSYNNFTDFTWRRSPKKSPQKTLNDDDAEKLSQEAFRLYRTAQNLLNLKEPILSEPKSLQSFHRNSLTDLKSPPLQTYTGPTSLQRKLKSRESHNSYQSNSTSDGSVHSNSSSVRTTETDEEIPIDSRTNGVPVLNGNNNRRVIGNNAANEMESMALGKDRVKSVASSSADDESGFSSMNSFHHEPNTMAMLPQLALNSTMLSNQLALGDDDGKLDTNQLILPKSDQFDTNAFNSLHSDIKAALPPFIHKRYDSAPPIPPKKKLTTFNSLKNENADKATGIHVLWV